MIAAQNDAPLLRKAPIRTDYVIELSAGEVRYVALEDFLKADIESVISQIKQSTQSPIIRPRASFGLSNGEGFCTLDYDRLAEGESWESRLRLHHAICRMILDHGTPYGLYYSFHCYLSLGKLFAFDECLQSWVKEARNSWDITQSYTASPEHFVLQVNVAKGVADTSSRGGFHCMVSKEPCVFRKTDFVKKKLLEVAERAEQQVAKENLETLNKSHFDSFVYIMEDRRNGTFKIGRSKTPGKRERTLQSEVPEVVLRFSVPADENDERRLHERFDPKRMRGEWFNLTADELLWIVSFLKKSGDVSRASADYEWLGKIALKASSKDGGE
jgi:hypothetical protein